MDILVKHLYKSLKDSGDLKELYPNLTGIWDKDKSEFILNYEINQEIINNTDVDFEDVSEAYARE